MTMSTRSRLIEIKKILEKELSDAGFDQDAFGEWAKSDAPRLAGAPDRAPAFDLLGVLRSIQGVLDA